MNYHEVSGVRFQVSGKNNKVSGVRNLRCKITKPPMKLQLKANRRTAEYRISNVEVWNRCAQSLIKWTEFIYSTFDVGRSMFNVYQFLIRSDRPSFWPEAVLTPRMKLEKFKSEPQNRRISNNEFRREVSLRSIFFIKSTEYIPSTFHIHYSIFDIRFFKVFFSIKLAAFQARGNAEH